MSVSLVARKHGISPSLLFKWRQRMAEGGREAIRADDVMIGAAKVRLLGRKTLEVKILKEALAAARAKHPDTSKNRAGEVIRGRSEE
jgi:transposase